MARPQKPIDADQVYRLAKIGCTQHDIAEFFGVDQSTISRRFASEFAQGRAAMRVSLHRLQYKRAVAGSDRMLIHLGQTELGQAAPSKAEVTLTVTDAMRVVDQVERALGGDDAGATAPE
jgi:transcriptional regulator with XRE-family HTH domain